MYDKIECKQKSTREQGERIGYTKRTQKPWEEQKSKKTVANSLFYNHVLDHASDI
jgi:hypothetical protein